MFFRKRSGKPPPSWVKWLFIGFVGYALIMSHRNGSVHSAYEKTAHDLSPQKLLHTDEFKKMLNPAPEERALRMADDVPGKGAPAVCGQEVTISYSANLNDGTRIESTDKDKPLTFRIGEHKVMPALEQGVVGMKQGGKRGIIAQGEMAYGATGFERDDVSADTAVGFHVELLKATPEIPTVEETAYRIIPYKNGIGSPILCGKPAKFDITIWNLAGEKIYQSKAPVQFTPGNSDVFLGLEEGVIGLNLGGTVELIVPPQFQKTLSGEKPKVEFPLPNGQTVLVDVKAVP